MWGLAISIRLQAWWYHITRNGEDIAINRVLPCHQNSRHTAVGGRKRETEFASLYTKACGPAKSRASRVRNCDLVETQVARSQQVVKAAFGTSCLDYAECSSVALLWILECMNPDTGEAERPGVPVARFIRAVKWSHPDDNVRPNGFQWPRFFSAYALQGLFTSLFSCFIAGSGLHGCELRLRYGGGPRPDPGSHAASSEPHPPRWYWKASLQPWRLHGSHNKRKSIRIERQAL